MFLLYKNYQINDQNKTFHFTGITNNRKGRNTIL